jgi:hypothetical protein
MSQNKKKLYEIIKTRGVHPALIKEIAEPASSENVPMQCSVGLEFELENLEGNFNKGMLRQDIWLEKRDGSLRGDGREFVLAEPIKGADIQTALENIYNCCPEASMVKLSNARTSMHMHVNVSDCSEAELLVFLGVCALADDYLFSLTNANRKNSGYCAASKEALIQGISNHQCNVTNYPKGNTEQRYRSINTEAIGKYGSIEFRHFAIPDTLEEARTIVKTCLLLKQIARKVTQELNVEDASNFKARKKVNKKTEALTRNILNRSRELLAESVNPDYLPEIKTLMDIWEIQTLLNLPEKKIGVPGPRPTGIAEARPRTRFHELYGADPFAYRAEGAGRVQAEAPVLAENPNDGPRETNWIQLDETAGWPLPPETAGARNVQDAAIEDHARLRDEVRRQERQIEQEGTALRFRHAVRQMEEQRQTILQETVDAAIRTPAVTLTAPRGVTLTARDLEMLQRAGINITG